jgi:hypothetical protein
MLARKIPGEYEVAIDLHAARKRSGVIVFVYISNLCAVINWHRLASAAVTPDRMSPASSARTATHDKSATAATNATERIKIFLKFCGELAIAAYFGRAC